MNIEEITEEIKASFPEISELYDAHLWTIIPNMLVYSAHVKLNTEMIATNQEELISKLNEFLSKKYKIIESTIQIISKDAVEACNF